jgi:hypothetical protein
MASINVQLNQETVSEYEGSAVRFVCFHQEKLRKQCQVLPKGGVSSRVKLFLKEDGIILKSAFWQNEYF